MEYFCDMNVFTLQIEHWYEHHGRDLPWRKTTDPYRIWVSEIILQQTRVEQGYDYYLRFLRRFPDLKSLADATEDEVLTYWQGLGYYSRARNLHAAARSIIGSFPTTYDGVRALKGVGDYTAAAICSFAYGIPVAVLDGNVFRVLSRYFGIDTPIDTSSGVKEFKALADELLDKQDPAFYNQAIMDFGALQCTPGKAHCSDCPLQETCEALRTARVEQLPMKLHKTQQKERFFHYLFITQGDDTFLNKRISKDIWRNLYELPLIESDHVMNFEELTSSQHFSKIFGSESNVQIKEVQIGVKHVLTHRIIYANFYRVDISQDLELEGLGKFIKVNAKCLSDYAFPNLVMQFLQKYI